MIPLKNQALKKYIATAIKGILMGAADVVPGVSGGTIAFITGIYEELIKTIDGLDIGVLKSFFKIGIAATFKQYNLGFLLSLITGIAISILSLSKLITYLLGAHPILVWSFFFGLVLASILYIAKQITRWNAVAIIIMVIGAALSYWITIAEPIASPESWWYLLFSGFIAIIAMILPGVSGAFLLLLLGSYETVLGSITGFMESILAGDWIAAWDYFTNLLMVAIGAILGIKLFSRALTWLFENHKNLTLALLTGFMIGSLNKLWPWKMILKTRINSHGEEVPFLEKSILPQNFTGDALILYAVILMVIGFLLILMLEKVAHKKPK
ncbi:integral membrane protein [Nonlabens ulvanivorans]|nr:integral membrane protein [Nonlabens ulvanivorans]